MAVRKRYNTIGLGGTFDHFHDGHRKFIDDSARLGEWLLIGITTPEIIRDKEFVTAIEPLRTRFRAVGKYCKAKGYKVELIELYDIYGPTIDPTSAIQALSVTTDTQHGAAKINEVRQKMGLSVLPIFVHRLKSASDGQPITSTRIRKGQIDRHGFVYQTIFRETRQLTQAQRHFFSLPQGAIITKPADVPATRIVVGDKCLETFKKNNWDYQLGVYDLFTQRQAYTSKELAEIIPTATVTNPAGHITPQLAEFVPNLLTTSQTHLQIVGEEDVATIVAVLTTPLGTRIYYGQPEQGIVELVVTESLKETFLNNLRS